jgi:tetratricopeptide (TPR) repeat protein
VPGSTPTIFNVPYPRNLFFTGRDSIIKSLYKDLNKRIDIDLLQSQAVYGLGGIGKTQTAIEYAYCYRNRYKAIFWVRADSHIALSTEFLEIAKLLKLPESGAENLQDVIRAVKLWLDSNMDWLMIFDNADELDLITPFWPHNARGHILLTSRKQVFDVLGIINPIEIKELHPNEALEFLLKRTNTQHFREAEKKPARELAKELGYLPLALEQAGAFIKVNKARFQDYLTSYRDLRLDLLKDSLPIIGDNKKTVSTTWTMNFEKVKEISEESSDLLRVSAFLSPDNIPLSLIQRGAAELGPALSRTLKDAERRPVILNKIIEPLTRYSLISSNTSSQTYSIHRLVQEVLRHRMEGEQRRLWAERLVRALARSFPRLDYLDSKDWFLCELFLPHAKMVANLIEEWGFRFEEAGRLLNSVGFYCLERARYAEAEPLFKKSLELLEEVLGAGHLEVAKILHNLANLYLYEGRYTEAESLCQQALRIKRSVLEPENLDLALSLNVLALIYIGQGNFKDAEPLLRQSVTIRELSLGPLSPYVAGSLNDLGFLCSEMGNFSEAEALYQRSLKIRKKTLGSKHHLLARSLTNLALLYITQKRFAEAEPLLKRALEIRKKTFGPYHPDVSASFNNLGTLRREQGRFKDAEDLYKCALEIREKTLGDNHPGVALILNNLAVLYYKQKEYRKSEPLYRRALTIRKTTLKKNHPYLAFSLHDLGLLYLAEKRFAEAEPLLKRALEIREKTFGPFHISVAQSLRSYAGLLERTERKTEAGKLKSRARNIMSKHKRQNR